MPGGVWRPAEARPVDPADHDAARAPARPLRGPVPFTSHTLGPPGVRSAPVRGEGGRDHAPARRNSSAKAAWMPAEPNASGSLDAEFWQSTAVTPLAA